MGWLCTNVVWILDYGSHEKLRGARSCKKSWRVQSLREDKSGGACEIVYFLFDDETCRRV